MTCSGTATRCTSPKPATTPPTPPGDRACPPNLITNVATTTATVPDTKMTTPIHQDLQRRALLPAEHYLDAGYPSAEAITTASADFGITMVTPALLDQSPQARAGTGFAKADFHLDWAARQAVCPQGHTSSSWSPTRQRGTEVIVVKFSADACDSCPARPDCTTSARGRRQLTLHPRELHDALAAARTQQTTQTWKNKYTIRAGAESTIHQAITTGGIRHTRYHGLPKTRLQHLFTTTAINLIRLHAYWHTPPLDQHKSSHLSRLELALTA